MSRFEQASNEAAHWIIAQADGPLGEEEQAAFDAWFAASEGNKAAYWRLEKGWEDADRIAALGRPAASSGSMARYYSAARWVLPMAASVALAVALPSLVKVADPGRSTQVASTKYETAIGKRQIIGFPDGSRVQLNTASEVRTAVTARSRDVWLDRGEAFFEVAHRDNIPFVVHAGDR